MLPNTLLRTAQGHPTLVELKNGETYNGHLVNCDRWMNIHLRGVMCKHGDKSWRMAECYINGNTINCLRVPDEVIDEVQGETNKNLTDRKRREMDDVSGRRPTKSVGMGRGQDVGGAIGFGGGQGRGGTHNRRGGGGGRGGQII